MPAVEMIGVGKQFGATKALSEVDFRVERGAIHAVVGENGAGKTTLMRILYGAVQPDHGEILLGEERVKFSNSAQAIARGIGMVSQHYAVIPNLTNIQNLMLGAEPGWFIQAGSARTKADELASRMGFSFDWNAESAGLSPSAAQKLEILKLLWRDAQIMILDEPTAMLSPQDSGALFVSLDQLTAQGATVILVTHRLQEVLDHCRRVTVLRQGRVVGDEEVAQSSAASLASLIVGRAVAKADSPSMKEGGHVLELTGVAARGYRGDLALKGLDLNLRKGEILGIAGVDGNGQRELMELLVGELRPESGTLLWEGESIASTRVGERLELGFRLIPEDRHEQGMVENWSLEENAALGAQRYAPFARGGKIDFDGRAAAATSIAEKLGTKFEKLDEPIANLSGGNQQRFVAGRALFGGPRLILGFQPARGLDIEATARFYAELHGLCLEGASAIVVSFDLDELLEHTGRILVMRGGRLFEPERGKERDRQAIGRLMVGVA